jgi:hypothetical protein
MIDLSGIQHHPALTDMVEVLCNKTQNNEKGFFRVEAAFFLGKMAACMRATIVTKDRGEIPVNVYALALATSGYGKGHSVSIVEEDFLSMFHKRFMNETFPLVSEEKLWEIANERAAKNSTQQEEEKEKIDKEFRSSGAYPFTFDSGTVPAVKQLRHKLLLAGCGSINLQIDEIGSNLVGNTEVLTLFLELFDQGKVKQKLTKNTADNTRGEEIIGKTPTNMLLFGTPGKLLDGGMTEEHFYSFLDTGYARRCIFGHGISAKRANDGRTPAEIYARLIDSTNNKAVSVWATHFHSLADPAMFGWKMNVEDDVGIQLLTYKMACERAADGLPEHEEIRKAELSHRYFKALKLAGVYAFIDKSPDIEMDHLMSAILLVEESGAAFQAILNREKSYVKLAKYIADVGQPLTHADLHEALPFYKASNAARNEMMGLAQAWGYKKHIIIKKTFDDNIEFFQGEKLKETNLKEMIISYSDHWAYHYQNEHAPFEELHKLTQAKDMHWVNHHLKSGHRTEENAIPGFNMISLDVDGGASLDIVHSLMQDYKFLTYTTKRHQTLDNKTGEPLGDRFRLILPINYHLEMDSAEYKEFINNVIEWLPFPVDESSNQRSKKWMTHDAGTYHYNLNGELLDVLKFIPKTSRNEAYQAQSKELQSLDNLERWFAQRISDGNRNNQMIKYALALVDGGMGLSQVNKQVHDFNKKMNSPLSEGEIDTTILTTVAKRYQKSTGKADI